MPRSYRIQIRSDNLQLDIADDRTLLLGLADHGIFLRSDCGGLGRCKKCQVSIEQESGEAVLVESCLLRVERDLTINIPDSSKYPSYIMGKAPLLLPETFRLRQPGTDQPPSYGLAIDLGTTTIGLYLCRMDTAEVLVSLAVRNPQAFYGDDVMNRISAIIAADGRTEELQRPVLSLIDQAIHRLCASAVIQTGELTDIVVAGNPTMIHIFLGVNPESIGISPYEPVFTETRQIKSKDLGITSCQCRVRTLPLVSGFIGADTLAAALAIGIREQPTGTLLVDLGTNGELVLVGRNRLFATSCATGPAFEGASLSCGMQATPGAIDWVEIDGLAAQPRYRIIADKSNRGKVRPVGICGSGIVSALASCLRAGIVKESGSFSRSKEIPCLVKDDNGSYMYQLVSARESGATHAIVLTQKDIRAVQLGKAALRAGIDHLLKAAGLLAPLKILVAGAFGSHINSDDMITLGMLPDIGKDSIENVGNAAGGGTVMALCDPGAIQRIGELASSIKTINLAANPDFQKVFVGCLKFPSFGKPFSDEVM